MARHPCPQHGARHLETSVDRNGNIITKCRLCDHKGPGRPPPRPEPSPSNTLPQPRRHNR